MKDKQNNKDNDNSFESNIYTFIICINMIIIIIIFIVSLIKLNKEDSIMKKYRITYSEKNTIKYSDTLSKQFNNSRLKQNVNK